MDWQEPLLAKKAMKTRKNSESSNDSFLSLSETFIFVDESANNVKKKETLKRNNVQGKHMIRHSRPSYMQSSKKRFSQCVHSCPRASEVSLIRKKLPYKKPTNALLHFSSAKQNQNDLMYSEDRDVAEIGDGVFSNVSGCCAPQSLVPQEEEKDESCGVALTNQTSGTLSFSIEGNEPHGTGGAFAPHCSSMSSDDGKVSLEERCLLTNSLKNVEKGTLYANKRKFGQGRIKEKGTKTNKRQTLQEGKKELSSLPVVLSSEEHVENTVKEESLSACPALINCAWTKPQAVSSVMCTSHVSKDKNNGEMYRFWEFQQEEGQGGQPKRYVMTPTIENCKMPRAAADASVSSQSDAINNNNYNCLDSVYSFTPEVSSLLCQVVEDHVLTSLIQNVENMMPHRQAELRHVAECLTQVIGHVASTKEIFFNALRYYVFGSVAMCTVLPDGDNDMTIEIDGLCSSQQNYGKGGSSAEIEFSSAGNKTSDVSNSDDISSSQAAVIATGELFSGVADYLRQHDTGLYVEALVVAEVRVLKLVRNGSCFDITLGQLGGVDCVRFLHELDLEIGCNHLLKRTLLLLKAWCCYEAHVLSGQGGYMSSYAATIMLIAMINTVEFLEDVRQEEKEKDNDEKDAPQFQQCEEFRNVSPFQLFARFLKFFGYFDFENYCVTVFGPLPCSSIAGKNVDLSRLEVHAPDENVSVKSCKFSGKDVGDNCLEQSFDVNFLGLTAEGQSAIGDRIRRRAKPFVTVSGVKHLLHNEHMHRQCRSTNSCEGHCKTEGTFGGQNALGDKTPNLERPKLNCRGFAIDDSLLLCSSCNTSNYPLRIMNVMDPLRWSASLSRGVCRNHLQRIRRAFREGLKLFEIASSRLSRETFLSSVSDTGSGAGVIDSEVGCNMETYTDNMKGHVDQFDYFNSIKMSILQDIFGQTLKILKKYSPIIKFTPSPLPLLHAHCVQCQRPSFFCVSDARQMCEPQYVFSLAKDMQDEGCDDFVDCSRACGHHDDTHTSSLVPDVLHQQHQHHHHHYSQRSFQQQRQDQQLNMLAGPMQLMQAQMTPMMSPVQSYTDPPRIEDLLRLGVWHGIGNNAYRDISMSSVSPAPHFARGAPLLRTSAKSVAGARGKAVNFSATSANSQSFFLPGHNVFPCYQGYAANGTPASFAPPLPPQQFLPQ